MRAPSVQAAAVRHSCLAALLATVVAALFQASAAADEYELGPQDGIRISVVEWTLDELRSPIDGEFTVSAAGDVILPLIGPVPAAGVPLDVLAERISERLQAKLVLDERPSTSVEVVHFRPFYILGEVGEPGEYAYRPGLTVLQALGLAGGFRRPETGRIQLEREALSARGDLHAAETAIIELVARQTRLDAELAGADSLVFPETPVGSEEEEEAATAQARRAEADLFEARRDTLRSEAQAQATMTTLFNEEQASLDRHATAMANQLDTVRNQLDLIRSLRERGLSTPGRELDLERVESDILSKRQEIDTQRIRVRKEHAMQQEAHRNAVYQRRQEIADELRQVRIALEEAQQRRDAARSLIGITDQHSSGSRPSYVVIRDDPEAPHSASIHQATEWTRIRPGDVLEVHLDPAARPAMMMIDPDDEDDAPDIAERDADPDSVSPDSREIRQLN